MQNLLGKAAGLGSLQFEHRAVAISASAQRSAVEIAGAIEDHTGCRIDPILAVKVKVMQHRLSPASAGFGRQLEDRTAAGVCGRFGAASNGRAIDITSAIEDQPSIGLKPPTSLSFLLKLISTVSVWAAACVLAIIVPMTNRANTTFSPMESFLPRIGVLLLNFT